MPHKGGLNLSEKFFHKIINSTKKVSTAVPLHWDLSYGTAVLTCQSHSLHHHDIELFCPWVAPKGLLMAPRWNMTISFLTKITASYMHNLLENKRMSNKPQPDHLLEFCSCKHRPYLQEGSQTKQLWEGEAFTQKSLKQLVPLCVTINVFQCKLYQDIHEIRNQNYSVMFTGHFVCDA